MSGGLVVNEIYLSLQGESTFAGLPCVFIRLTACDLRCSYCDTAYAFTEGRKMSLAEILKKIHALAAPYRNGGTSSTSPHLEKGKGKMQNEEISARKFLHSSFCLFPFPLPLVELTGGEPLLQKDSLPLMTRLGDEGFTVLLETNGAQDIAPVDARVHRIMDWKCPSSGEAERNRLANLAQLKATDEIKFVIGTREDYAWAKRQIAAHKLAGVCPLLFSWAHPLALEQQNPALKKVPAGHTPLSRTELAERILADALPVRFQIQQHKIIWPPDQRGV